MRLKKVITLIFVLVTPILFYLFLRVFGKNQYSLPFYDTQNISFYTAYLDSLHIQWKIKKTILYMPASKISKQEAEKNEIRRLLDATEKDSSFQIVIFYPDNPPYSLPYTKKIFFTSKKIPFLPQMKELEKELQMDTEDGKALLIDKKGNVRGLYSLEKQGEIERITVELNILENN
ncbi:MAG: hypothetical protein QM536_04110 [Chitinophagaceae bacterium]|nr:hypothetical protein [Chitinophagaceae bacterium]